MLNTIKESPLSLLNILNIDHWDGHVMDFKERPYTGNTDEIEIAIFLANLKDNYPTNNETHGCKRTSIRNPNHLLLRKIVKRRSKIPTHYRENYPNLYATVFSSKEEHDFIFKKKGGRSRVNRGVRSKCGKPCPSCGAILSLLWRRILAGDRWVHMCNACGLQYKKNKYCPGCSRTYCETDLTSGKWESCQSCHMWSHKACLIEEISLTGRTLYTCTHCIMAS